MQKNFCGKVEIMDMYDSDLEILRGAGFDIPATRFVRVRGEGLENSIIDTGVNAVLTLWCMAEKNEVPYAESIELDYCANCDITFKGDNLLLFLEEYYPNEVQKFESLISLDSDYTLSCIDFS
ncbi:MAG: hypothetical protein K2O36_06575 [Ruminococcus sp.]|nr:hypothetical protein [Ruminococcus sp.]